MRLKAGYQYLLLALVVLVVYYPALSAGISTVDDPNIIASYEAGAGKTLAQIFRPAAHYYYRPLIELTYYLDNLLWSMHPRFMHLENILLHTCNTLLVFCLARLLAQGWSIKARWFPLAASLLFALHPVNSESVIWLSGRTDPLSALFVLAALCFLLQGLRADRLRYLWPSLLLFAMGVLSKEVALCFLPVALLLTAFWPGARRIKKTVLLILAGVAACGSLLLLAFAALGSSFSIAALLHSEHGGGAAQSLAMITALGFYLKKLVVPWPLNFAIDAVSPFYLVPGVLFLVLVPFWLRKRSLMVVLVAAGSIFLLPALLLSVKQVAWTPYAERYLYLPCVFFSLGLPGALALAPERLQRARWILPLALCLAVCAALVTAQRALLWRDNLDLYRDTVHNSPGFGAAHLEYARALLTQGKLREGRAELEAAERLNQRPSIKFPIKAGLMAVRLQEGDSQGARDYFYRLFPHKESADADFLRLLDLADGALANKTVDIISRNGIYSDMIDTYNLLYKKTGDPFYLFQGGKMAFKRGEHARALDYMRQTVRQAPAGAHYSAAAVTWVQKLEAGL